MRFVRLLLVVGCLVAAWSYFIDRPDSPLFRKVKQPAQNKASQSASLSKAPEGEMLWGCPKVELQSGLTKGVLKFHSARSAGLYSLYLRLESQCRDPIMVSIAPGTLFKPRSAGIRDAIVIRECLEPIQPGETSEVSLQVASANMLKPPAAEGAEFDLSPMPVSEDLRKLVSLPGFSTSGVKQFAIWTITDNPERAAYRGIPTSAGPDRLPSDADFGFIHTLFSAAGISTGIYKSLAGLEAKPAPRPVPELRPAEAPLIGNREWTDKRGRKLEAELVSASLDPQGLFEGLFRRPSGEEFTYRIGLLLESDVELVKNALIAKGLYKPKQE